MIAPADRHLAWLLRFSGLMLLLAWPTIFFPTSLQVELHGYLGIGEFPSSPLVDYLSRSIAILYGTRGVVHWVLSSDIPRFLPLIRLFAWMDLLGGALLTGVGIHAGFPLAWILGEGPPLILFSLFLLWISMRIPAAQAQAPG